jgi:hypothetical protein
MKIRTLVLGAAVLALFAGTGAAGFAADADEIAEAQAAYSMRDGAPPPLGADLDEETAKSVSSHFKQHYGSENGPFDPIAKQEAEIERAKKKIATYSMTFAERQEAERQAAEEEKAALEESQEETAEKKEKKWTSYVYNRSRNEGTTPPRLFNNVPR